MYKNKTFHPLTARLCAEGEQKVLSTFSKVVQSRVKLWSPSAEGETLYYLKRIFERSKGALLGCHRQFCPILYGQKSKLQIENLFSIHFSAREKAFTNYRIAQIIPEKFPVGSFRQQKPFP